MTDAITTDDDASLQDFRREVREFVARSLPLAGREKVRLGLEVSKEETVDWQRRLAERGWLAPHWPTEWQGCAWSAGRRAVFQEELVLAHAPETGGISVEMIGPIL